MERSNDPIRRDGEGGSGPRRGGSAQRANLRQAETGDQFPEESNFYSTVKVEGQETLNEELDLEKGRRRSSLWLFILLIVVVIASLAIGFYMPGPAS